MAEFPALPLWTDAYLGDTTHLTTIEHGAYLLLLMAMWRNGGSLPDDDRILARYAGLNFGQWNRMAATIRAFMRTENGLLTQGRLTDELGAVKRHSRRQSNNSKARWLKTKETDDATQDNGISGGNAPLPLPLPIDKQKQQQQSASAKTANSQQTETGEKPDSWNPDRLLTEVLGAVGLASGRVPTHWMPPASALHVWRWVVDLHLTPESIVDAARESRKRHSDAPTGPKALDGVMTRLAAEIAKPPMQPDDLPPQSTLKGNRKNERASFDRTINALADGLDAGTIKLDNSRSDPFAALARHNAQKG